VSLVIGVNGAGKTTTIAKLAYIYKNEGKSVLLCAADTFRAAAVEQLKNWADSIDVPIVAPPQGSDPASAAYDAVIRAQNTKADEVIIDTAGRLHTKHNLMEELKKIHRVIGKARPGAPDEILLVLDGTSGQNALSQARVFSSVIPVTGIVITKLDGTAKGGIALCIAAELKIPVLYAGLGEKPEDLTEFDPEAYAGAIFEG
jgi:fused signal recognition particle receptor